MNLIQDLQPVIADSEKLAAEGQQQAIIPKSLTTPSTSTKIPDTQKLALGADEKSNRNNPKSTNKSKAIGYAVDEDGAQSYRSSAIGLHFLSAIPPEMSITAPYVDVKMNYEQSQENIIPKARNKRPFNIGVGYSPDFSTVGIGNFVSPGSRWIVAAEYAISNRFLLNTGYTMVNNKYEAYGEDYHAPSRYWKKGIIADEAYGECKMIDVPLNLRYTALIKGKSRVFISAGASTYFVQKEDYYFHYDQEDPELPDHWGTEKMTIYPFGIINFSAGYQYFFTGKSSLQIEPFIKVPTTGIGWGKVDLYTMGVFFMYKYHIGK